jgi:hypothetical protein
MRGRVIIALVVTFFVVLVLIIFIFFVEIICLGGLYGILTEGLLLQGLEA